MYLAGGVLNAADTGIFCILISLFSATTCETQNYFLFKTDLLILPSHRASFLINPKYWIADKGNCIDKALKVFRDIYLMQTNLHCFMLFNTIFIKCCPTCL
jgi:hypothetical protein